MKILLLGGTGRTGRKILETAEGKGHEVNCLVRNPSKIQPKSETTQIFEGNPLDLAMLEEALQGCEAVLGALNVSRSSDFPWSSLRSPENLLSEVAQNLIHLSGMHVLRRVVICSAWGVGETKKDLPWWFRSLINHSNIGPAYRDHERQEKLWKVSDLNWTMVRPVGLTNSNRPQRVVESYNNDPRPGLMISRTSVAAFMVDALENPQLIGKSPTIFGVRP